MDANSGLAQQIAENKTDLMDILPDEDLQGPVDDLGLTLPFLAVYYDRPDMLDYLRKRGVDLRAPCDPMDFGNPMFYAIHLKKTRLILHLDILGCSVREPCDSLKVLPLAHVERLDDPFMKDAIHYAFGKEERARVRILLFCCFFLSCLFVMFSLSRYITACLHSPTSHDTSLTIIPHSIINRHNNTHLAYYNLTGTLLEALSEKKVSAHALVQAQVHPPAAALRERHAWAQGGAIPAKRARHTDPKARKSGAREAEDGRWYRSR
jgi:hypothetical protein